MFARQYKYAHRPELKDYSEGKMNLSLLFKVQQRLGQQVKFSMLRVYLQLTTAKVKKKKKSK